jgi:DMSO/TMAO reductase YedYZ molybdopterin-dependent catalytic subunit
LILANLSKEMIVKLKPTLAASLFAIMAALSLNASAAADTPAGASAASDTPANTKVEKAAPQKKMKRHSHVEEKTGFAPKAPEAMPDKPNAAQDKTKHYHPRDGK